MHPAFLYRPGERLALAELAAARLDGDVVEVGDAYIPADLIEGVDVRAKAVAPLVRPGTAAAGPTAAWIYGAGDAPPSVHHIRRTVSVRIRRSPDARLIFHDSLLAASDVQDVDAVAVCTPVRTMIDLATSLYRDPALLVWMLSLAEVAPFVTAQAITALRSSPRAPGIRIGLDALEALAGQDDVTR